MVMYKIQKPNSPLLWSCFFSNTATVELSSFRFDRFQREPCALDMIPGVAVITLYPRHHVLLVVRV